MPAQHDRDLLAPRPGRLPVDDLILRSRLLDRLDHTSRVALVVAPPGFGKTTAVAQWTARSGRPTAWVSVDLLDDVPATFWSRVIGAIRSVVPEVDAEPEAALDEGRPGGRSVEILCSQLRHHGREATVVLDGFISPTDGEILDGIAVLVERVGDLLQLVITTRADPALPMARWREAGWVVDLREHDLRFTDDEALAAASTFGGLGLSDDLILGLNRRAHGWPIAFQLALVSTLEVDDPSGDALALTESDRQLTDFLVGEILDQLAPADRAALLDLSVVEWFDPEIAEALAGPTAGDIVADLRRRRLLLTTIDERPGVMRFHRLFRELLEGELRWRDRARHEHRHRAAAEVWRRRNDVGAAYRHLTAIGDVAAAHDLIVKPVLELVDHGDLAGLTRLLWTLPAELPVDDPDLALDLALAAFFAGDGARAGSWCDRAERLASPDDTDVELRLRAMRCILELMDGHLDAAAAHVARFEELAPGARIDGPIEQRFATVAARVALSRDELGEARRWVRQATVIGGPDVITNVTLPGLVGWLELSSGRVRRAIERVEPACAWAERAGVRPHHGALDALVTAASARLAAGQLARADEHAEAARTDADLLGFAWTRLRAGMVAAQVRLLLEGPGAALALIDDLRATIDPDIAMVRQLDVLEATVLHRLGRDDAAGELAERAVDGPRRRLVLAALAAGDDAGAVVADLLAERAAWTLPDRLEAAVLMAASAPRRSPAELRRALEDGAASGWVAPFIGHGAAVDAVLLAEPLERLHPALAAHLRPSSAADAVPTEALVEPLTAREVTILELLPTHLSYAQIGEQLFLSVNTVKSNLKSVYRKLAVPTRSEAVASARAAGLI